MAQHEKEPFDGDSRHTKMDPGYDDLPLRAPSGRFLLIMESPTPVEAQPIFGSVWSVPNKFQRSMKWKPDVKLPPHPMACTENKPFKRLRRQATIEAVPRTTDPESANYPELLPLPTEPGDPVHCEKRGTFLCRYRVPVLREGYSGFAMPAFLGELSTTSKIILGEKLQLLKVFE